MNPKQSGIPMRLRIWIVLCMLIISGCSKTDSHRPLSGGITDLFTLKTVTMPALASSRPTKTATPTPTSEKSLTATITPTETSTPIPIVTPTSFFVDISAYPFSASDKLEMVDDITIPDGTMLKPGQMFIKSWRIKNVGNKIWNNNYRLALAYSNPFNTPQMTHAIFIQPTELIDFAISTWNPRQYNVGVNDTVDLVIPLQAPEQAGDYMVEFFLINSDDEIVPPKIWIRFSVELLPQFATQTAVAIAELTETATPPSERVRVPTPTPQPFDWTGTWLIRNPYSDTGMIPVQAWLTQSGDTVTGFFYDTDEEPVLIEGTVDRESQGFIGKFAQPWQNRAVPVKWRMLINRNQFYAVTDSGETEFGTICGGRNGMAFPEHCSMPPGI
ncbi:MAG TPA: NBR1-Ig-like domain-containing protein [Flexilinea sp.]|nr:NBR1-Ig-like domain-containing protein [Flexilinea sp.]